MEQFETAQQELNLNIKHQNIQVKEFAKIGYEFDKGIYIFVLMFPKKLLEICGIKHFKLK